MTPVDCPESPAEFRYNLAHAATREIVDRTFRAIQTRFRCLDGTKGYLQVLYSMANVSQPIIRPKHISRNKPLHHFNLQTIYLFVHALPSRVPSGGQTKKLKDVSPVSSLYIFFYQFIG